MWGFPSPSEVQEFTRMTHETQESMVLRIIRFYCKGYKSEPASEETHRTRSRGSQMPNFLVPSRWNQDTSLCQGSCVCAYREAPLSITVQGVDFCNSRISMIVPAIKKKLMNVGQYTPPHHHHHCSCQSCNPEVSFSSLATIY